MKYERCTLQENVVRKQLTLYDQETTDQYVVDYKVLTQCFDKQSGFSVLKYKVALE